MKSGKDEKKGLEKKIAELEGQKKNAKKTREEETKKAEKGLNDIRRRMESRETDYKKSKELLDTLR